MKFKIRFADQIVGFFVVFSLVALIFVVVMLGRYQRWLANDLAFTTVFESAGGLSKNMAVQYKGFTIGNVKSFHMNDEDNVEVVFVVHENYSDRVKLGSMVELMVSPVGLGNQFLFHPGRGEPLPVGSFIPAVGTVQARELIRQRVAVMPQRDDSISLIMSRANTVLEQINRLLGQLNPALGRGSESTEIGQIVKSIRRILTGAEAIPHEVSQLLGEVKPILADINAITSELNEPDSLLYSIMDTDKEVYTSLVDSLVSLSSILDNLDKTTALLPGQVPALLSDLRVTLKTAEDVLTALTNNPLLKKGVPDRPGSHGEGANPRNIPF